MAAGAGPGLKVSFPPRGLLARLYAPGGWSDALAGLTLASMNIPQVLGYAAIAGMPAVTGLYTVLLPLVAFAVLGSSRHLVVAADSATAAIIASGLAGMAVAGSPAYVALVGVVAWLAAAFLLGARLFRLGFLADFFSRTVLVGFLTGVGVQVCIAMSRDMLGVAAPAHNPLAQLVQVARGLPTASGLCAGLSLLVVALILAGGRLLPRAPMALVAVVGAIAASRALDLAGHGVAVIGPIAGGLPSLVLPDVTWNQMLALLPVAGSCVVVIIAQSAATSRAFALRFHERVDENADILGLSAANAVAALTGAFVVNGSPTQTAMALRAGARSQRAQLVFALVTLVVLLVLTGPLRDLPRCVLSAIVFSVAAGMIDWRGLLAIRRESPGEFRLAVVTGAAVVGVGVEQGIFLAIALSLFRHVRHSYRPHSMVLLVDDATGLLEPVPAGRGMQTEAGLVIYRFGADLFYANCSRFADDVRLLVNSAPTPLRCLIVDASAITDLDFSAAGMLRDLLAELRGQGVHVLFGRVSPYLRADMDRHRITTMAGADSYFTALHPAIRAGRAIVQAEG
ncbi:SulP family inorganic anion transporter [Gluconacetobacter liquefaciens]|uniref:MFS superfamily sulfate permease-like transporter n=1 Tax=Gluconacetobacter liquefaciens TaxID=89584 RepID=A0A370G9Z5_GLULI|nr:SulP family inorganic anion transporter [Gluconacetobacter liquefaciens]MBB2185212.1 SulP family inorganic anion transporter [Gluconacetobacter liquefaciens]RDI40645.1 MFS superfamily sulfate permease-like transporter [Gluconacetobacter liquefaciens]GEB36914.1 SulP family inorganic anion transporter [Gluconacetobacter liquefaciens]